MSTRIAKPRSRMRKQPRQARSRATVEAIIEAGAHVLSALGWAGFTTNKVADARGSASARSINIFPTSCHCRGTGGDISIRCCR